MTLLSAWLVGSNSSLVRASYDFSQVLLARGDRGGDASSPSVAAMPPSPDTKASAKFGGDGAAATVAIVYLDLDSYLRERQNPAQAWSRSLHAQLLHRLTAAGAKAVVFDIIFEGASANPSDDDEFAQAIRENGKVILAGEITRGSRNTGTSAGYQSLQLTLPDKKFLDAALVCGVANATMDDDFIVRRQFQGFADFSRPSLATAAANVAGVHSTNSSSAMWLRYYGKPLTIPHVSYSAALRKDEVADDFFREKIIFVGARPMTGTILERKDEFRSPLSAWGDRRDLFMPAVEVHATQLLNLLRGDSLSRLPLLSELFLLALAAVVATVLLFAYRPLYGVPVAIFLGLILLLAVSFALHVGKIWFPWLIVGAVEIPGAFLGSLLFQSLEWYRQKKKFEAQRRADELKIREQAALIEKAQDAIWVEDLSGTVFYANPSAERLYGWSLTDWQSGEALKKIFFLNEAMLAEARQAARAKGEWLGEFHQTTRDGKKVMVTSRCTLIRDERGDEKSLLFINTDVTEQKKLEQEFYRAQRIESIGVIAGGIAHDLNNSLSPVLMGLQMLRQQKADEETQRMLAVMEDNTHRSADMVKQVLLFSRGNAGEKTQLAPGTLLREMERIARQTFPKSISVAALVPNDLWPVLGDATQLHQVLLNLCVNARDAMPQGGELTLAADNVDLTATEAAQIPNARAGRFVMLLVADTGGGIAPEILPQIFEPFFTTKPVGQGTGLGLSTTARIVAQHGGFVSVKSDVGKGTSFEIYLPATTAAPVEQRKNISAALPPGNGELILVVDDEQSIREMISLGLIAQNYRVVTAANGAEAITRLQANLAEVRLILLDDDMPVLSGRAAWPQLRARAPGVPVVFLGGDAGVATDVHRLSKPFSLEEMLMTVARCLA